MPAKKPTTKKQKEAAIKTVMEEFAAGALKSSSGKKVTSRKMALAIALSYTKSKKKKSK